MKFIAFALAMAGVICASGATEDSFLYWMVGDTATLDNSVIQGPYNAKVVAIQGDSAEWSYQGDGGIYLNLYNAMTDANPIEGNSVSLGGNGGNLPYFAGLGSTASGGWTYFIELYNDSRIFAHSDALPYAPESIATLANMSVPGTAWNVKAFVPAAVPEPNSGLLLLLGVAGLALRRRKQIAA